MLGSAMIIKKIQDRIWLKKFNDAWWYKNLKKKIQLTKIQFD